MIAWDNYYAACAPDIGRPTIAAIVKVESGGNPWAINDDSLKRQWHSRSYLDAVVIAKALILQGHSVDIGLAQINSRNLPRVGMSVEEVLEPCRNLMAASVILKGCYIQAASQYGQGQRALVHALSCYNTGSLYGGRRYVQRVFAAAGAADKVRRLAESSLAHPAKTASGGRTDGNLPTSPLLAQFEGQANWRIF